MDFAAYTTMVRDFVVAHPNWAAAVVFALSFGESLAFVSLFLPFWAMLVTIGAIIGGTDSFNFWFILFAAGTGAALGDWLSYWLGFHYHEKIQGMWPLKNYPNLIERGRTFFEKWGTWAIILARFSGPLRASVPIAAGIAQMPQGMFQLANWTSAYLWAFVLLTPGAYGMKWWYEYFV